MTKQLTDTTIEVLALLQDGAYHDGTEIGKKIGITRSAVWKVIKKLQHYGVDIHSVKNKGYALSQPLQLLDVRQMKAGLNRQDVEMTVFETVSSTNDYLMSLPDDAGIQVCFAEQQTAGRGRLNRNWYSPFGHNVYCSCLYPFRKDISELSGLSLVVSLSVFDTLMHFGVDGNLGIKWPNDILYHAQKLSGSLIEIRAETHGVCRVVIGIGMNVNMMHDEADAITQPWTSLRMILNRYLNRNELGVMLMQTLLRDLKQFEREGFPAFISRWNRSDCLRGKEITILNLNQRVSGVMQGVNAQGQLLMQMADGKERTFASGDTTVCRQ